MKQKIMNFFRGAVVILLVVMISGCGNKKKQTRGKIVASEIGLSMNIPRGWTIDKHNPQMCFKGDYTGIVIDEPLEGKDFYEYAEKLYKDFGGKVISKIPLKICGYEAVKVFIDYPKQDTKAIRIFIKKNGRIIEISFTILKNDFMKYKSSILDSLDSIEIK